MDSLSVVFIKSHENTLVHVETYEENGKQSKQAKINKESTNNEENRMID